MFSKTANFIPGDRLLALRAGEGIAQVEEREFPEIPIMGIQGPDTVLKQDGDEMGVRDEVAANRQAAGHMVVGFQESIQLGNRAHVRQRQ